MRQLLQGKKIKRKERRNLKKLVRLQILLGFNYLNLFPKLFFKMLLKTDILKTTMLPPPFLVNSLHNTYLNYFALEPMKAK